MGQVISLEQERAARRPSAPVVVIDEPRPVAPAPRETGTLTALALSLFAGVALTAGAAYCLQQINELSESAKGVYYVPPLPGPGLKNPG